MRFLRWGPVCILLNRSVPYPTTSSSTGTTTQSSTTLTISGLFCYCCFRQFCFTHRNSCGQFGKTTSSKRLSWTCIRVFPKRTMKGRQCSRTSCEPHDRTANTFTTLSSVIFSTFSTSWQIYFTDLFLGYEFTMYGTRVLDFIDKKPEDRIDSMNAVFPKVTKCTFNIVRATGNGYRESRRALRFIYCEHF